MEIFKKLYPALFANKKRGIIGYFGEINRGNLGDDAVFTVLERMGLSEKIAPLITNWEKLSLTAFRKALKRVEGVMIGGGTQFTPLNKIYFDEILNARKPTFSFGTGVGNCGFCEIGKPDLSSIAGFLSQVNPLTVRGPESHRELKSYGIIGSTVVGDPALGYANHSAQERVENQKRICVNLTTPSLPSEIEEYKVLYSVFGGFLQDLVRRGWEVVFAALGPGDVNALNAFSMLYRIPGGQVREFHSSADRFIESVASSNLILGVRLHSAILAACAGVPFLLVNYREKCRDFASSMSQEDCLVHPSIATGESLHRQLEGILDSGMSLRKELHEKATNFKNAQAKFLEAQIKRF